jgi:S-DNA-T family DNA segregation ATPase FtsK/SpoIIIE
LFNKGSILRESVIIALFSFALILLISLITYHSDDPGFSTTGTSREIANYVGLVGAYFSSFTIAFIGLASYCFPILFFVYGFNLMGNKNQDKSYQPLILIKFVAFVFVLLSTCGLASIHLVIPWMPEESGGIVGLIIASFLLKGLGMIGTTLLLLAIWLAFMPIFIGFSWIHLMRQLIRIFKKFIASTRKSFSAVFHLITKMKSTAKKTTLIEEQDQEKVISQEIKTKRTLKKKTKIKKPIKVIKEAKEGTQEKQTIILDSSFEDTLPELGLLDQASEKKTGNSEESIEAMSRLLELKLKDFGIDASVEEVLPGPIVTRYEVSPAPGVKVSQISNLSKDLARSLSVSSVRIVEVIEGKSVIGIEVPNDHRELVVLGEILKSTKFEDLKSPLSIALGKDISGDPIIADLGEMPHLLIAGTTGSGKSVGINAMVLSLLYKATKNDIRLIMIDPKMLELSIYEDIPHLMCPVVTDMKKAANALRWCVLEMDRRYKLMASLKVRNLEGLNKIINESIKAGTPITDPLFDPNNPSMSGDSLTAPDLEPLPYIIVIIDELADMMLTVGKKVEALITRLAAKARAAGIHMIIATQRPSVDVITGLIKANIPSRIAFQVSAKVDSRTILDQMGAENLLGNGDMLYIPPGSSTPIRVHGAFVSDAEVKRVSESLRSHSEPIYIEEVTSGRGGNLPGIDTKTEREGSNDVESDPLYDEAVKLVTESRNASISSVQRRLRIGYNRAARIVEQMEEVGLVGPLESNGKREILAPPPPED